ncbi:Dabb family protein [Sodalis sp. RH16]|uniref:Dabb family protein n=1 Tax=Sodalis sp. RH16 TaxID=3394331 RepID=UPI0039B46C88
MIQHNVLFRFKATLGEDEIHRISAALLTMDRYIPGILNASWHENISREQHDYGFRHKISLYFADNDALEIYLNHRHHLYVRENIILPSLTDGVCSVLIFDALLSGVAET